MSVRKAASLMCGTVSRARGTSSTHPMCRPPITLCVDAPGCTPPASGYGVSTPVRSSSESCPRLLADAPIVAGVRTEGVLGDSGGGPCCTSPCWPSMLSWRGASGRCLPRLPPPINTNKAAGGCAESLPLVLGAPPTRRVRIQYVCCAPPRWPSVLCLEVVPNNQYQPSG